MRRITAQDLANTVRTFVTASLAYEVLFTASAWAAVRRQGAVIVRELANSVWAFATAAKSKSTFLAALAREVERRLGDFNLRGLANTACAFATANHSDSAAHGVGRMRRCSAWASSWRGPRQHSVSACGGNQIRRFRGLRRGAYVYLGPTWDSSRRWPSGRATPGRVHCAGALQYFVGVYDCSPIGFSTLCDNAPAATRRMGAAPRQHVFGMCVCF